MTVTRRCDCLRNCQTGGLLQRSTFFFFFSFLTFDCTNSRVSMSALMNGHNAVEATSVLSPVQIDSKIVRKSKILNDSRSYVHFVAGG